MSDDLNTNDNNDSVVVEDIAGINAEVFIAHALNTLRMIPGSFYVLGIFVVSAKKVFENDEDSMSLKTILKQLFE